MCSNKIVTIHDLAFLEHPEWFSKPFYYTYKYIIPAIAKRAKHIITVSNFSKEEITNKFNLKSDKISIVHNGVSKKLLSPSTTNKRSNFVLFVGSLDPRKNITSIVEALRHVPNEIKLKVVGAKAKSFKQENQDIPQTIKERIEFTGYVSDEELKKLYNEAMVFVYPSLYEGFGIPPLEAQALNCPTIVSDIPVFHEVFENSAVYCDNTNPKDIAKQILRIKNMDNSKLESLLLKGRNNVQRFNWDTSTKKLSTILQQFI